MSFAIYTSVKYEHDYINQFIEHHLNLGISHIYIIVDNVNDTQIDYDHIINNIFCDNVTLYYVNASMRQNNHETIHNQLTNFFNNTILNDIKEDWVITIGVDSFIYLNGFNKQRHLSNFFPNVFII
jgi:hypothetical protein